MMSKAGGQEKTTYVEQKQARGEPPPPPAVLPHPLSFRGGGGVGGPSLGQHKIQNSVAFGKSTSQRIYPKQLTDKIG